MNVNHFLPLLLFLSKLKTFKKHNETGCFTLSFCMNILKVLENSLHNLKEKLEQCVVACVVFKIDLNFPSPN